MNYIVTNNIIDGYYNGISLFYCGGGSLRQQKLELNWFLNSAQNGIRGYNSEGQIIGNQIIGNDQIGIKLLNNCNFSVNGYPNPLSYFETQQFTSNIGNDIFASEFSFPYSIKYNSIDDPFAGGVLIKWERPINAPITHADISYNHFGTGFNPLTNLEGNNVIFDVTPYWYGQLNQSTPDEDLFKTASLSFESGNYADAKTQFQLLIDIYPNSQYAEAAMKELVKLEEFLGKNYSELQQYYQSNDTIVNDTTLSKLADILINDCDIKLENYQAALTYYEDKIENSQSETDSIFAIIDLGYVYELMEQQGLKSNFIGRYPQFKPTNRQDFITNRKNLLALIPKNVFIKDSDQKLGNRTSNILIYPNPSRGQFSTSFSLDHESKVKINIIDFTGKTVLKLDKGRMANGFHSFNCDLSFLPSGIYLFSLIIDNSISDTKKIVLE